MSEVWLNGEFLDEGTARIPVTDRGFLLGDGAFETMRFSRREVRRWTSHIGRLSAALDTLKIAAPDWRAVREACHELPGRNETQEAVVRLTITRGSHGRGFNAPEGEPGTVLITAGPRPAPPDSVSLVTIDAPRRDPSSLATRFKPIGYASELHARRQARQAGADMALMLATDGRPACADCANIVWIKDRRCAAPGRRSGALHGTTRAALLSIMREQGLIHVEDLPIEEAEAAFVCNAVMGVVPVSSIDGRALDTAHETVALLRRLENEAG